MILGQQLTSLGFDNVEEDEDSEEDFEDEEEEDYSPMTKQQIQKVEDGDVSEKPAQFIFLTPK